MKTEEGKGDKKGGGKKESSVSEQTQEEYRQGPFQRKKREREKVKGIEEH